MRHDLAAILPSPPDEHRRDTDRRAGQDDEYDERQNGVLRAHLEIRQNFSESLIHVDASDAASAADPPGQTSHVRRYWQGFCGWIRRRQDPRRGQFRSAVPARWRTLSWHGTLAATEYRRFLRCVVRTHVNPLTDTAAGTSAHGYGCLRARRQFPGRGRSTCRTIRDRLSHCDCRGVFILKDS